MATLIVCPRCHGSLQANARACPRCGLVLEGLRNTGPLSDADPPPQLPANRPSREFERPAPRTNAQAADNGAGSQAQRGGTAPYSPVSAVPERPAQPPSQRPRNQNPPRNPAVSSSVLNTAPLVPRGALQLLPNESVAFQLGALYLTNKRVILLAPSVVRAAFVRDIDAVGTLTERASGWNLFGGLLMLGLSLAGVYASTADAQQQFGASFPWVYAPVPPLLSAGVLALIGVVLLAIYFVWVKRTLFVSVKGRPLITVSIADWNSRRIAGMDAFVNAFFQVKDAWDGEDSGEY